MDLPKSSVLPQYVVHRQAPEGINQGMIYRLFTYPPEHQLAVLDQLNAVGFKVMYEVGHQLNRCGAGARAPCDSDATDGEHDGETDCHVCFNESKTKLHWLEERIRLVMHHPAILGYCMLSPVCCCYIFAPSSFMIVSVVYLGYSHVPVLADV